MIKIVKVSFRGKFRLKERLSVEAYGPCLRKPTLEIFHFYIRVTDFNTIRVYIDDLITGELQEANKKNTIVSPELSELHIKFTELYP